MVKIFPLTNLVGTVEVIAEFAKTRHTHGGNNKNLELLTIAPQGGYDA